MTLQECKENHQKLWNWIADESEKRGYPLWKSDYFRSMFGPYYHKPRSSCYACQYANELSELYNGGDADLYLCSFCPIQKDNDSCFCIEEYNYIRDIYDIYRYAPAKFSRQDLEKFLYLARKIANLEMEEVKC